jgi:hypothetical protein
MPACDLLMVKTRTQLRAAATNRQRVRVRGVVAQRGGGHYGGGYRNVWLQVQTPAGNVRVTASLGTPLGTMPVGSRIELAVSLTGMVNLAEGVYIGERAQVLASTSAVAPEVGA